MDKKINIIKIEDLSHEGLKPYFSLTDHQLKNAENGKGWIVAESPKVIDMALDAGYEPISLLCEEKHIIGDAKKIIERMSDITVFTGERNLLSKLTGYTLTRGVLCAMKRKEPLNPEVIVTDANRIAVLEAVCDATNIGAIFRSATALGFDGILLTSDSCDPLNRRSIRVSMGTVLKMPWAMTDNPIALLKRHGFATIALSLKDDSLPLNHDAFYNARKIAVVLGSEGYGLTDKIISDCDYKAIIPMAHGVDSLNVAAAAAIAFWHFQLPSKVSGYTNDILK